MFSDVRQKLSTSPPQSFEQYIFFVSYVDK